MLETIPYSRDATSMPDKDGNPVSVGDWVDTDRGPARVTGLSMREEHEDGRLYNLTGNLDLKHSTFEVSWPGRAGAGFVLDMLRTMNFRGDSQSGRSPANVRLISSAEAEMVEKAALNAEISALRQAVAILTERLENALLRKDSQ